MKSSLGTSLCALGMSILVLMSADAQDRGNPPRDPSRSTPPALQASPFRTRFKNPGKRVSEFTTEDWNAWIDSTWGPGQTATQQLSVFDTFWNRIDASWGGFPNISLNWDSIRTLYRPQVAGGLSRGRFAGVMSRVWMSLMEAHVYITDLSIDKMYGNDNTGLWAYKSGVPLLLIGTYWWDLLGAPVTALPDGTGLVYRVSAGNPLGLQPGDVILGYEGVPWSQLYSKMIAQSVPVNRYWSFLGSTPESCRDLSLSAVGWNWGMFDTIDVVKYSTGDTLHLPTAPLASVTQNIWASDQVPVAGVPLPEGACNNTNAVSWGVVEGTTIGYIYIWDFTTSSTAQRFADAVTDLRHTRKVSGLIIDLRMNWGGDVQNANAGLARLFGFDPTVNWSFLTRSSTSDHLAFTPFQLDFFKFTPVGTTFDRPIAVLIGPGCLSAGDYNAFRLRFHPMARSFGKPTNGAFVAGPPPEAQYTGFVEQDWKYWYWPGFMLSLVPGEGPMIHKGVQPDESIWLTRQGVSRGEDDVVKRAIQWMTNLAYAHNLELTQRSRDTLQILARVENPPLHTLGITATLMDASNIFLDSLALKDDGKHGDGNSNDGLWGATWVPAGEGIIRGSVRTDDISDGTSRTLWSVAEYLFSKRAKIVADATTVNLTGLNKTSPRVDTAFVVKNIGWAADSVSVTLNHGNVQPDTAISVSPTSFVVAPQDSQWITFTIRPQLLPPAYYGSRVTVTGKMQTFNKSFQFQIVTAINKEQQVPNAFALDQNYPNPCNPSATIRYGLPERSPVNLSVYNTLGQQVTVLQNGEQESGYHEVKFDASNLPSGLYFYRLQAGTFVETRKLCLVR
jgi:hypothetical protein